MLNIQRILVPIDFSEYCSQAITYGWELARTFSADVDLVHIIEEPTFPAFYKVGEEALHGKAETLRERAQEALRKCVDEARPDVGDGITFYIERGKAADKIVEVAREHDTEVIVISTHGLGGLERVLMGSVAEKVVQNAPSPVFIVKSFGKALVTSDA